MIRFMENDTNPMNHQPEIGSQQPHGLTARQIAAKRAARAPISEYIWRRTAEVKLDFPLAGVSGRVGKYYVYYRRFGKQLTRQHTVPTDPRTQRQLEQRQRMSEVSREWHQLSAAQRQGWQDYTIQHWPEPDGGKALARTGKSLFTSAQLQRLAWGGAISHAAPQQSPPGPAYALEEVPGSAGSFSFRMDHSETDPAGCRLLLEMTPACTKLTNKPLEQWLTRAGTTDAESFFLLGTSGAAYVLSNPRYQVLPGQRFGVRVTLLNADGIRGKSQRYDLIRLG